MVTISCQYMTSKRQTPGHGGMLFASMLRRSPCRQNHHRLVTEIVELTGSRRTCGQILQFAPDRQRKFLLHPEDCGHIFLIFGKGRKPWTRNRARVGGRTSTDQANKVGRRVLYTAGQKKSNEPNNSNAGQQCRASAHLRSNSRKLPVAFRRWIPFR